MRELRSMLDVLSAQRDYVAARYKVWDDSHLDYDTSGEKTSFFHPPRLPGSLPSSAAFIDPDSKLSSATRTFAAVINHTQWLAVRDAKAALKAGGLVDALKGDGPFTVFAPTDEAFAKLPKGTVETLLKPENKDKLVDILTYHVISGKVASKKAVKLDTARALNKKSISLE